MHSTLQQHKMVEWQQRMGDQTKVKAVLPIGPARCYIGKTLHEEKELGHNLLYRAWTDRGLVNSV
jgi:hypothetical protein